LVGRWHTAAATVTAARVKATPSPSKETGAYWRWLQIPLISGIQNIMIKQAAQAFENRSYGRAESIT
jgi:hypothetical protein